MIIVTIGKNPSNNVVVNDSKVSDYHLQIMQDEQGNFYVKDMESATGTFVNKVRITGETPLNPADVITIGRVTIPWQNYFASTSSVMVTRPSKKTVIDTRASAVWGVLAFLFSFASFLIFPAILSIIFGVVGIIRRSKAKGLGIVGMVISTIVLILYFTVFASPDFMKVFNELF